MLLQKEPENQFGFTRVALCLHQLKPTRCLSIFLSLHVNQLILDFEDPMRLWFFEEETELCRKRLKRTVITAHWLGHGEKVWRKTDGCKFCTVPQEAGLL